MIFFFGAFALDAHRVWPSMFRCLPINPSRAWLVVFFHNLIRAVAFSLTYLCVVVLFVVLTGASASFLKYLPATIPLALGAVPMYAAMIAESLEHSRRFRSILFLSLTSGMGAVGAMLWVIRTGQPDSGLGWVLFSVLTVLAAASVRSSYLNSPAFRGQYLPLRSE
jgi:hypothetical protein